MLYMDTHYGHTLDCIEVCGYTRDRVVSCGQDNQVIFYKISEDTQLLYKNNKSSTSCLSVVNDEYVVTGSDSSTIELWSLQRKKPMF